MYGIVSIHLHSNRPGADALPERIHLLAPDLDTMYMTNMLCRREAMRHLFNSPGFMVRLVTKLVTILVAKTVAKLVTKIVSFIINIYMTYML